MRKLDDAQLEGKRVLLRIDVNSPLENGKIVLNPRFHAHAQTVLDYSKKNAKIILLAHQGRKGKKDFTSLEEHAKLLGKLIGKKIQFVDDITGEKAKAAIGQLQNGEILLLDNVRRLTDEEKWEKEPELAKNLTALVDIYVLDAFSIAHRKHTSVVAFAHTLPCYPGPVLSREISALKKINKDGKVTFVVGGSKVHDAYLILKRWLHLGRVDKVLLSGVPAILGLYAKGYKVGKSHDLLIHEHLIDEKGEMEELFSKFGDRILLPVDVGIEKDGKRLDVNVSKIGDGEIKDIGEKTRKLYTEEISKAHTIVMNGSCGVYEEEAFAVGTKAVLQAIADSNAFSIIGGGHTISAIEKFGIPKEKLGYISLAGKAFLQYLEGKELAGLKALEENEQHLFDNK